MHQILMGLGLEHLPAILIAFVPALLNIGLLIYVQFFLPHRQITTVFGLFIMALLLWQFTDMFMRMSQDAHTAALWDSLFSIGWMAVAPLGLHFTLLYTGRKKFVSRSSGVALLYLPVLLLTTIYCLGINERTLIYNPFLGWINPHNQTWLDQLVSYGIGGTAMVFCGMLFAYSYKHRFDKERMSQSLLIAVGLAIPIIQGLITQIILPAMNRQLALPITTTFMSVFTLATVIGLSRYRLFDIAESIEPGHLINALSDIVFTISPDGRLKYLNSYGYRALQVKDKFFEDVYYKHLFVENTDFEQLYAHCIKPSLQGYSVENYPAKMKGRHGSTLDVLLSSSTIRSNNIIEGAMFIVRDVTQLYQAEMEKEANIALFSNVVRNMQAGVLIEDENRNIYACNKQFCEIFKLLVSPDKLSGADSRSITGQLMGLFIQPAQFMQKMEKMIARKKACRYEELPLADGRTLERDYTPIYSADAKFVGHLWVYRDITARKQAEADLQRKNDELAKVNTELDRFVYSASHDIRAPLRSILGLIHLAESDTIEASQKEYLAMIRDSVNRLDNFTLDIIHYSNNTRLELQIEPIDFQILFTQALSSIRSMPSSKSIRVESEIVQEQAFYSDTKRLTNILVNLISNAVRFHDLSKADPFIKVAIQVQEESVRIAVSDNGSGIGKQHIDKIFDMFYRGTDRSPGSGLGLYITKEILDKLKGSISVSSTEGEGSVFEVQLPNLKPAEEPMLAEQQQPPLQAYTAK